MTDATVTTTSATAAATADTFPNADLTTVDKLIDRYIEVWNERGETRRRELIASTWAEDATYCDPALVGEGRDGIDTMTAGFQAAYPGATFQRAGTVDLHHDRVRFGWHLRTPDGQVIAIGSDCGVIADGNVFASITGFFEQA